MVSVRYLCGVVRLGWGCLRVALCVSVPAPGRPESRQLKPQASGGAEIAIERDDVGAAFGGGGGAGGSAGAGGVDTSQLDGVRSCQHRVRCVVCWHTGSRAGLLLLCQVEGAQELPAPDAQSEAKARELPDVCAVVGDYIVRCFCSKVIAFRGHLGVHWSDAEVATTDLGPARCRLAKDPTGAQQLHTATRHGAVSSLSAATACRNVR